MRKLSPRVWLPIGCIFLIFTLIALRLGQLQLALHKPLKEKTMREVSKSERRRPLRGRILDRTGRTLATTTERPSISVSLREVKISKADLAAKLAHLISGVTASDILERMKGSSNFVWIKRLASTQEGQRVEKAGIKGVSVSYGPKRLYPYAESVDELLGTVTLDGEGASGLEFGLNPLLEGEDVLHIVLRDALGKVFAERLAPSLAANEMRGRGDNAAQGPFDVYLTIDAELQENLDKHLSESIEAHEPLMAMAIVEEIQTGAILAMGSRANSRRLGKFSGYDSNATASFTFEPGSVIKPFVMASALEEDVVEESQKIDCENESYRIAVDRVIRDHEPYSVLTIPEVLAYSSNIGMAKISEKLGPQALYSALRAFGFGTKTALPVAGEAVGILRTPESWTATTPAMISFGYEMGATTLQLVNGFAALANDGVLPDPQIVDQVKKPREDAPLYRFKARKVRSAVSANSARRTLAMMRGVVDFGTGKKAELLGYPVAGKTGTAQKLDPKTGKHSSTQVMVTFCGVLPMPKPRFSVCAVVDEPTKPKVAWAADIAAPLFSAIAQDTVNIFNVPSQPVAMAPAAHANP